MVKILITLGGENNLKYNKILLFKIWYPYQKEDDDEIFLTCK